MFILFITYETVCFCRVMFSYNESTVDLFTILPICIPTLSLTLIFHMLPFISNNLPWMNIWIISFLMHIFTTFHANDLYLLLHMHQPVQSIYLYISFYLFAQILIHALIMKNNVNIITSTGTVLEVASRVWDLVQVYLVW